MTVRQRAERSVERPIAAGLALLCLTVLGGCARDETERLPELRATVDDETALLLEVWREAGLDPVRAVGETELCQSQPRSGVTYSSAGALGGEASTAAERFVSARDVLVAAGWSIESDTEESAGLRKGELSLSVAVTVRQDRPGEVVFALEELDSCLYAGGETYPITDGEREVDLLTPRPAEG